MKQVLIYKSSPDAPSYAPRLFFVREHDPKHDDIETAQKDSDSYNQSKFNQYPDRLLIDSRSFNNKTHEELIEHYELFGDVCLNVKRVCNA